MSRLPTGSVKRDDTKRPGSAAGAFGFGILGDGVVKHDYASAAPTNLM
jgi:hypothetical protein